VAGLTALLLFRGAIWGLLFASISLLENASDLDSLRVVAKGAAIGLVLVVAVSVVVIPAFGAAGPSGRRRPTSWRWRSSCCASRAAA
jgi:hypothetical protein